LSRHSSPFVSDLKECVDKSLEVLNLYFNPGSNLYLGIHNPNVPLKTHSCLSRITDTFRVNRGSLQPTRKASTTGRYVLSKQNSAPAHSRLSNPWGKISEVQGKSVNNSNK
jgi:hypothetical protein